MILNIRRFATGDSVDFKIKTTADTSGLKKVNDDIQKLNTQTESVGITYKRLQKQLDNVNADTPLSQLKKLKTEIDGFSEKRLKLQSAVGSRLNKPIKDPNDRKTLDKSYDKLVDIRKDESSLIDSQKYRDLSNLIEYLSQKQGEAAKTGEAQVESLKKVNAEISKSEKVEDIAKKTEDLAKAQKKSKAASDEQAGGLEKVKQKTEEVANAENKAANTTGKHKNKLKETREEMEKTSDIVGTLKKGFEGLAIVKLRYLLDSIRRVSTTMVHWVESAAGYEESLNLYRMALGKFVEQADTWARKISDALLIDPSAIMQYTGAFYNLTKGLGVASDAAYLMSTNLTQLTYDMASYLNISEEMANVKLQSAMSGQARAIQSVGVAIQVATLEELAYSLGITKSVETMTQAEKTYLRYIQIMKSTTQMQGDLGRTMITPANAIRILKTQLELLGRSIGQVLTPIIMHAIPYLMAFANVLEDLAQKLAAFLGYKVAPVDYSSVKFGAEAYEDYGDAVEDAAGKINRSLAPFDKLNVVESKSSGRGTDPSSVIGDLEKYITGYDMLAGYNDTLKRKAKDLESTMKGVLKGIGIALGTFLGLKVFKTLDSIVKLIKGSVISKGIIKGAGKISKTLGTMKEKYRVYKALFVDDTLTGIGKLKVGTGILQDTIGKAGRFAGAIGSALGAFAANKDIIENTNTDLSNLNETILKGTAVTTGLIILGGVLGGIPGAALTAAGAIAGLIVGADNLKQDIAWEEGADTLFDGVGRSIDGLSQTLEQKYGMFDEYNTKLDELKAKEEETSTTVDNAKTSIILWHDEFANSDIEPTLEDLARLKTSYNDLETAMDNNVEAQKNLTLQIIANLHEQTGSTEEEYKKQTAAIIESYAVQSKLNHDYLGELEALDLQRQQNLITDVEYQERLAKLNEKYGIVDDSLSTLSDTLSNYINLQGFKWDLGNYDGTTKAAETLNDKIKNVINSTNEYKNEAKTTYETQKESLEKQIEQQEKLYDTTVKRYGADSEEAKKVKTAYDELTIALQNNETAYHNTTAELDSVLKDFLLSVGAQLDTSSDTIDITNRNLSDVFDTIKEGLKNVKDADTDSSANAFFKNMDTSITNAGKKYSPTWSNLLEKYGVESSNAFGAAAAKQLREGYLQTRYDNAVKDFITSPNGSTYALNTGKTIGTDLAKGVGEGVTSQNTYIAKETNDTIDNAMWDTRDYVGIHSPSEKWADKIGKYLGQGIGDGIANSQQYVADRTTELLTSVENNFKKSSFKINIDTGIEDSLSSMLAKLQKFCDNWRSAINDLMNNTKKTMNGIKIGGDGKVTYSSMPQIKVKQYESGGYAKSGDLFFANENGRAEFMTHVGNQTAVYNQDQMVTALTNAIMSGFSSLNNNEPHVTQVYIDGVYRGQTERQNRDADRYGTSTIKV